MKGGEVLNKYLHCRTDAYSRRGKTVILCTAAVCSEVCIAAFFVVFFNIFAAQPSSVSAAMLVLIALAISVGMIICLSAAELSEKKVKRHSRYTYLDIQPKGFILSVYAGEYRILGEKTIFRDIYYVPFRGIKLAELCEDEKSILITGEIRHFCMNSDNLGYHISDGDFDFDRPLLNVSGFETKTQLKLPPLFGKPAALMKTLSAAYKEWQSLPLPKPKAFREADFIRRRPKTRALPDSFGFDRSWK